tara:strand:+ start:2903 stop:3193 length:291 start_codon:yes stop_codon:yes gene_type:complete
MKRDWMIKVFFIAKIKNFNNEYYDYSKRVREKAETMPGFIDLVSEEKDDVEITISSWKTLEDVDAWRTDPLHKEAKAKSNEWYHWVKGIHVEAKDE